MQCQRIIRSVGRLQGAPSVKAGQRNTWRQDLRLRDRPTPEELAWRPVSCGPRLDVATSESFVEGQSERLMFCSRPTAPLIRLRVYPSCHDRSVKNMSLSPSSGVSSRSGDGHTGLLRTEVASTLRGGWTDGSLAAFSATSTVSGQAEERLRR